MVYGVLEALKNPQINSVELCLTCNLLKLSLEHVTHINIYIRQGSPEKEN